MTERVVAVVEARMGSSRLPGKSLMPLAGAPLVERVIERVRRAQRLDAVVLATSTSAKDDPLAHHVAALGVPVFRGSELDVLGRILGAAREHRATIHVQIWGDCPFVDPAEIDRCVDALVGSDVDLVGNDLGTDRTVPVGLDVLAFRVAALERAERETTTDAYHREHGSTYLYETGRFRCTKIPAPEHLRLPELDATINTASDYEWVSAVYEALHPAMPAFGIADVARHVRRTPALLHHPKGAALRGGPGAVP